MAKMIERPSGLEARPDAGIRGAAPALGSGARKDAPAAGPGSGAVDRTISDVPLKTLYGPEDVAHLDLARDLA